MPELKPLPCPYCGTEEIEVWDGPANFMECQYCHMTGPHAPSESSAIGLWNSLPRALTWTTEPPKVAGWYWRKETAAGRAHVFHFTGNWEDYGEHWESDRVCPLPLKLNGNLWAGPIPTPLELEES